MWALTVARHPIARGLDVLLAGLPGRQQAGFGGFRQRRSRGILLGKQEVDAIGQGQPKGRIDRVDAVLPAGCVAGRTQVGQRRVVLQGQEGMPKSLGQVDGASVLRIELRPHR